MVYTKMLCFCFYRVCEHGAHDLFSGTWPEGGIMGKKLYVGNLPYNTDEDTLSQTFSQCGTVESVKIITDRDSGRSKGFGFVEMSSDNEAQEAIDQFNGTDMGGRSLTVNEARPMTQRPNRGGGGGYRGGY